MQNPGETALAVAVMLGCEADVAMEVAAIIRAVPAARGADYATMEALAWAAFEVYRIALVSSGYADPAWDLTVSCPIAAEGGAR